MLVHFNTIISICVKWSHFNITFHYNL